MSRIPVVHRSAVVGLACLAFAAALLLLSPRQLEAASEACLNDQATLGILDYASGKAIDSLELVDLGAYSHALRAADAGMRRLNSRARSCDANLRRGRAALLSALVYVKKAVAAERNGLNSDRYIRTARYQITRLGRALDAYRHAHDLDG
jgi:hypothetical protein